MQKLRGDRAGAVATLEAALAGHPQNPGVRAEFAYLLRDLGRIEDAEAAFHRVLARQPENVAALNYLGYMLAERGERLDESVRYLKKALEIEPDNGSFLDSLGWAYYKSDKLDLALDNLQRAADQLKTNSVIQDHYGDVLFKLKRYDEAIAAWTRVLSGDGESIDRGGIDKKIRALSGGEKTRLVLARMLLDPPNFLVLDEPTNHLDLATKEMLLEALKDFDGTMLFVSHDRPFLRALSNKVLELGGESGTEAQPHLYPGSYVEYVERTGHEAPGVHA